MIILPNVSHYQKSKWNTILTHNNPGLTPYHVIVSQSVFAMLFFALPIFPTLADLLDHLKKINQNETFKWVQSVIELIKPITSYCLNSFEYLSWIHPNLLRHSLIFWNILKIFQTSHFLDETCRSLFSRLFAFALLLSQIHLESTLW